MLHVLLFYATPTNVSSDPLQSVWDTYRDALFLTDPIVDRETLRTEKGQRTEGTCEWIRGNTAYKSWLAGETPRLWISGGPGKGKTMLSMFLTEELEAYTQETEGTSLLFYFCTHRYEEQCGRNLQELGAPAPHEAPRDGPAYLVLFQKREDNKLDAGISGGDLDCSENAPSSARGGHGILRSRRTR